jgi:hypothetical protein
MPFCTQCGKIVDPTAKFCGVCGKPISIPQIALTSAIRQEAVPEFKTSDVSVSRTVNDPTPTAIYSPGKSLPSVETIKMVVPDLLMIYGFGKSDTFNLVITTHKSIFAKLTKSIKEQSQKKRKNNIDKMKINPLFKMIAKRIDYGAYIDWYTDKTPQEILNETPGNYAIENTEIVNILIKDETSKTEDGETIPGYELVITTRDKTLKFKTNLDPENIRKKSIYEAYKN